METVHVIKGLGLGLRVGPRKWTTLNMKWKPGWCKSMGSYLAQVFSRQ